MTAGIYTDFSALQTAQPWLAENTPTQGSIFQTLPWFQNLYCHGLPEKSTLALLADDRGCLPLLDNGQSLTALSNYYSSLFAPLSPTGALPASLAQLFKQLGQRALIDLHPIDSSAPYITTLKQNLAKLGYWVDDYFCFGNWYLDVAGQDFQTYLSQRPSQLRNNIQRGRNKLDKAGQWQITIHQQPGAALDAAIAAFETVYAQSWKTPEPHPRFIPELCRTAAQHGWLRLGILTLNDVPIAAQLWLTYQDTANIYKLAYIESAQAYSAGSILTAALMEQALDVDQVKEVDYLTGDESYKQDWMSHRRERHGIVGFQLSTWRGLSAGLRHWVGRLCRRVKAAH